MNWNDDLNRKIDSFDPNTPFGKIEKDAFRKGDAPSPWDNNDLDAFSANTKKCPGCGANLIFEAESGVLICRSCGNVYDPQTMEMNGSLGIENPEQEYGVDDEIDYEDRGNQEIVCNSCGSQIVTDANTAATICPFCGSPALVTRKLTRQFRPDAILPFSITEEKAKQIYKEHVSSVAHVPKAFTSSATIEKMRGMYIPFWLISADVKMDIGGWERRVIDGSAYYDPIKQEANGNHAMSFPMDGTVEFSLKNIPFDGSRKISNRLMQACEPFDFSELVPYNASYLTGFLAEKYDSQPKDMYDVIKARLDNYCHEIADSVQFEDCDHFDYNSAYTDIKYSNFSIIYCLLPIWFLNVKYEDLNYRFAINGQTGEVCGTLPETFAGNALWRAAEWMNNFSSGANRQLRHMFYIIPGCAFGFFLGLMRSFPRRGMSSPFAINFLVAVGAIITFLMIIGVFATPALYQKAQEKRGTIGVSNPRRLDKMPEASFYLDTTKKIRARKKLADGGVAGIVMPHKLEDN